MCSHRSFAALVLVAALFVPTDAPPPAWSAPATAPAAEAPVWTTYTNGNALYNVAIDPATGEVWTSSIGGAVRWSPDTGTYTKFTTVDGLSDNHVNYVQIDPVTGAKWIGTNNGVNHLDAEGRWTTYLRGYVVRKIAFDTAHGDVWFGMDSGAPGAWRLDRNRQAIRLTTADGLLDDGIGAVTVDAETGDLWFASFIGIQRRSADGEWSPVYWPGTHVNDITIDYVRDEVWVASQVRGVMRLRRDGSEQVVFDNRNSPLPWYTTYTVTFDDATGDRWIATNKGVARIDAAGTWTTYTADDGLPGNGVFGITVAPDTHDVWFAVNNMGYMAQRTGHGLGRRSPDGRWRVYRTADGIRGTGIGSLDVDQQTGEIWIVGDEAVNHMRADGKWETFTPADGVCGIASGEVRLDQRSGEVWVGCWEHGVGVRAPDGRWTTYTTRNSGLPADEIAQIEIDPVRGDRWFATLAGLARLDAAGRWHSERVPGLPLPTAAGGFKVHPATGDVWLPLPFNKWFHPGRGVYRRAADGRWTAYTVATTGGELPSDNVHAVEVDGASGAVWFATDQGVRTLSLTGEWGQASPPLDTIDVTALTWNPRTGDMWCGANGQGAFRLAPDGTWTRYTIADSLPSDWVEETVLDPARDVVWFRTSGGLSRLGPPLAARSCDTAIPVHPGEKASSYLTAADDLDIYRLEVPEPFSRIELTVPDVDDLLTLDLFRTCDGNIGAGAGRHIGAGAGRHIGGAQRLVFEVGNQTGTYYIAVSPKAGAESFPLNYTLGVSLTVVDPNARHTLILTHAPRVQTLFGLGADDPELVAWRASLDTLAADPAVAGLVVANLQTDTSPAVAAAYAQWLAHPGSVGHANAVAEALRDWLWQTRRSLPYLRYVILAGDDRVIPHGRIPIVSDQGAGSGWVTEDSYLAGAGIDPGSGLAAALAGDFTLSDDVYAAPRPVTWGARHLPLYVPELAVGRLVERPAEMTASVQAFLAHGGEIPLDRAVLGGYDFMADAVRLADAYLGAAGLPISRRTRLLDAGLTADGLRAALLDSRGDLAFLAAHADHQALRLPAGGVFGATDVAAARADPAGSLVYALACHGGLNVPGTEHTRGQDLPQAWLGRGAAYVGTTGWAYGLDGFLAYNEALMTELTRALVVGGGTGIGDALVYAKQRYFLDHVTDAMHAKALAATTLYGLPMYRLRVGAGASAVVAQSGDKSGPPADDRRRFHDDRAGAGETLAARPAGHDRWLKTSRYPFTNLGLHRVRTPAGDYYAFTDLAPRGEAGEPVQPVFRASLGEVTFDQRAFEPRGIVLTAAAFHEVPDFRPVIQPAGVMGALARASDQAPTQVALAGWRPATPIALRHLNRAPGAGLVLVGEDDATLLVTVGQYHAASRVERLLDEVTLDEYYSAAADRDGPMVTVQASGGDQTRLDVTAEDPTGVDRVVVAHAGTPGRWLAVELDRGAGGLWHGDVPGGVAYLVQAVDAAGNVTTVDELGRTERPCASCTGLAWSAYLPAAHRK